MSHSLHVSHSLECQCVPHRLHRSAKRRAVSVNKLQGESAAWRLATAAQANWQRQPTARECRTATSCQGLSSAQQDLRRGARLSEYTGFGASNSGYGAGSAVGASDMQSTVESLSWERRSAGKQPLIDAGEQNGMEEPQSSAYSSEEDGFIRDAQDTDRPSTDEMTPDVEEYIDDCQQKYGINGLVEVAPGRAGLPYVYLRHPSGYTAEVSMQGANVTSLLRPDGTDILFLMPGQQFDNARPIKGGIPIVFPQYGRPDGLAGRTGAAWHTLPINGFLNHLHWSMCASSQTPPEAYDRAPSVSFVAESDDTTLSLWPHKFTAVYTVSLMYADDIPDPRQPILAAAQGPSTSGEADEDDDDEAEVSEAEASTSDAEDAVVGMLNQFRPSTDPELLKDGDSLMRFLGIYAEPRDTPIPVQLCCNLQILNTGEEQMMFSAGLQTHIAVNFLKYSELGGVASKAVLLSDEVPNKVRLGVQTAPSLTFGEERLDRVYVDTACKEQDEDVTFHPGDYRYSLQLINRAGFKDLGVWNPYKNFPDSTVYRKFVALPQGAFARPVKLEAGDAWEGEMVLRVHEKSHLFDSPPHGYEAWEEKY